jgi:hypothetical protein
MINFRQLILGSRFFVLLLLGTSISCSCENTTPGDGGSISDTTCVVDSDCASGQICSGDACVNAVGGDGDGDGDGGQDPFDGGERDGGEAGPPPAGELQAIPGTTIEFGAQRIGLSVERNLTLINAGNAPLTIVTIFLDGNESEEFTVSETGGIDQNLDPDDAINLTITHIPSDAAPDQAALRIVHTADPDQPLTIDLFAEFKGQGSLSVSSHPQSLEPSMSDIQLGDVPVGMESGALIYLRNSGASDSILSLSELTLTPLTVGFSVDHVDPDGVLLSSFNGFCESSIDGCPAGASACTEGICVDQDGDPLDTFMVELVFTSTQPGPISAVLSIEYTANGDTEQQDIAIIANGTEGQLIAEPGALQFGDAIVTRALELDLAIQNAGDANVTLSDIIFESGEDLTLISAPSFPLTLEPGEETTTTVQLIGSADGPLTDNLVVLSDQGEDLTVPITADRRFAPLIQVTSPVVFGETYRGTLRTMGLPITNLGPGELAVTSLVIEGDTNDVFSVAAPDLSTPLAPLADPDDSEPAYLVVLSYQPLDAAPNGLFDTAILKIHSNDPDTPVTSVDLTGISVAPQIVLLPATVDFGAVALGQIAERQTVEIHKTGFGDLLVTDVTYAADGPYVITVEPSVPSSVTLGGDPLRIHIDYTPTEVGQLPIFAINVHSNDLSNPAAVISVLGEGIVGELEASPTSLAFPETFVDYTSSMNLSLSNVSETPVEVSGIALPMDSQFSVEGLAFPFTIQPGFARGFTVDFSPTAPGFNSETLTILSDLPDDFVITLTGSARYAPSILVEDSEIQFGGVFTGNTGSRSLLVRNAPENGEGILHIVDIRVEGPAAASYSVVPSIASDPINPLADPTDLTPSLDLSITYTPDPQANTGATCAPEDIATLVIESDDPETELVTIPLSGLPITPTLQVTPTLVSLGGVKVGTSSDAKEIVLENTGCGPLAVSNIAFPLLSRFSLTPSGGAPFGTQTLAKGETATLTAYFNPQAAGQQVETAVIYSNDEANPAINISLNGTGLIGALEASPISFNDRVVGLTAVQDLTLINTGDASVVISGFQLASGTAFALTAPSGTTTLEPSESVVLSISFSPDTATSFSDTLEVTSDLPSLYSVNITGNGIYEGEIFLDPISAPFGDQKVDGSYQEVVQIRNQGSSPLLVTEASITGDAAFTISTDPVIPQVGQVLQPFVDSIALTVTYAPTATGAHSATVFVTSSDPDEGTASVSVSGNGIQGQLEAAPSPLQFAGATLVDGPFVGREVEKTITLSNTGSASVIISALTMQDPSAAYPDDTAFSIASLNGQDLSTVLPYTLGVNGSVPVAIRFLTEAAGTNFADQLQVQSDLAGVFTVNLQGESRHAPSILLPGGDVDFGGIYVGNTGSHTLSIRNEGTDGLGNLTILEMDITGPNANRFSFSPSSFTDTLAPLASAGDPTPNLSVDIIYTPDPNANQSGTCAPEDAASFVIQSDDPDQPTMTIPLKGLAINPTLSVEPSASANFLSVKVGTPATVQVITLRNLGCGVLQINNLAFPAGTSFSSSHQGANPFGTVGLQKNQTTTFNLGFQPSATGTHNATFFIHSNDETNSSQAFALTGVGILGELSSTPANLDFPNGAVDVSDTKTITLRNTGDAPLNITSISLTNSPTAFSVTDTSVLLAPNATHSVDVTFLATTPGNHQNILSVTSDLPDSPFSIALNGDAAYEGNIVLTPATYNFGEYDVFSAAPSSQIVITNDGPSPLEITAINVPAADGFSAQVVGETLPFVMETTGADSSLTIQVDFTPQSPGDQNASLTITNTDPDNGSATVALSGRGKVCDSLAGTNFVQTGPNCTYSCLSNFWDLNGDLNTASSDGCEYACVFANANDTPDDAFVDSNCDGIDGVIADAIFVDTGTGNDANSGSMVAPLATIGAAIATQDNGRPILVSTGTYNESLNLKNGASIYGGYAAADNWSRSNANGATIAGGVTAVTALSISSTTLLTHLNISAASNTSGDSIGLYANASSGLVLRNLSITAQDGADGTDGTGGTAGGDGSAGTEGTQGCDGCSGNGWGGPGGAGCLSGNGGGIGGRGGYGSGNGSNGDDGNSDDTGGPHGSGGSGDGSHSCLFGCSPGGAPGGHADQDEDLNGSDGTDGVGGDGIGTVIGDKWTPSDGTDGTSGGAGDGGGGGGGGGGSDCCIDDRGGGGGGGGGGGCGGTRGTAGTGGYSSFGVFLHDSSITMVNVDVTSGNGGNGGEGKAGGSGGTGGARGAYGAAADDGDRGGYGAKGGDGGTGGHGGGGGGGLSYCIFRSGSSSPTLTNISYSHENAGTGGAGGGTTNGGSNGSSGNLY